MSTVFQRDRYRRIGCVRLRSAIGAWVAIAVLPLLTGADVRAVDGADARRILAQKCFRCHGPDAAAREADLRLDSRDQLFGPRDGQPAVVPGRPNRSEIIRRITATDPDLRMPPSDSKLTLADSEITLLKQWIAEGAPWTRHWAFEPIRRTTPPRVGNAAWRRNPIDRFVLAKLERAGLEPSKQADSVRLARRLHLDLTGLPFRAEPVRLQDAQPLAYGALVDRLLASPRFGERWGQHWLDLARYADSDGYEMDYPRPNAWRWRDWVIRAINADMPLDQFALEQVAGDLIPNAGEQQILATGFHRNTLTNTENGIDREEFRVKAVVDRVNTTATVWLGLTAGCAECHDHKYDPLRQREFYGLYAFFNNGVDEFDLPLLPAESSKESKESKEKSKEFLAVFRSRNKPRESFVHERGDFQKRGERVEPSTPAALHAFRPREQGGKQPDRLDLARWIIDPRNPLTPRVEANRIWQQLFGVGLVRTPDDFGVQGDPPTHPELLDYLAAELIDSGWSRKHLIRLIVDSATYRQSSDRSETLTLRDPDNRLLARQNRFRLEAEVLRDQYLAAAGLLSSRIGGPSFRPPLPASLEQIGFKVKWRRDNEAMQRRRGMYIFYHRNLQYPMLKTFDRPDPNVPSTCRRQSNSPLQSLTQLHGPVFLLAGRTLGLQIARDVGDNIERGIALTYDRCLQRAPTVTERRVLRRLYERLENIYRADLQAAAKLVGRANRATPDDVAADAAWIELVRTVMNLDEFVTRE